MSTQTRPLNFYVSNDGIFVFEFTRLDREAAGLFIKIVEAGDGKYPSPFRLLFDFSDSQPPTPYFLRKQAEVNAKANMPNDTRSAYVSGNKEKLIWVHIVQRYIRQHSNIQHEIRAFVDRESAVAWLVGDED